MTTSLKKGCRSEQMVEAIRSGAATTSRDLAAMFGSTTTAIAPELTRLADMGLIARGRPETRTKPGRPCLQWRAP